MDGLGTTWRKSSRSSSNGNCVEARRCEPGVQVRDSKDATGPALSFPTAAWQSFIDDTKSDRLR